MEKAAEEDNPYTEYLLGKLYLKGEDIEQDVDEAERLLRRSSEQGNKYAAYSAIRKSKRAIKDSFAEDIRSSTLIWCAWIRWATC